VGSGETLDVKLGGQNDLVGGEVTRLGPLLTRVRVSEVRV
jgi:hypothetical protein